MITSRQMCRWIFLLLVFLVATAFASEAHAQTAQQLAAKVDHHYNALNSLSLEFTQEYDGLSMHKHESGTLLLKKPGRMRWTYDQPRGKLFVLDGTFAYFYSPGSRQVQKVPAKQLDDLHSPLRFLLGHTQLEKEMVNLRAAQTETGFMLFGTPKGMEKRVSFLSLIITADGAIRSLKMVETNGAVTSFEFTDEKVNAPAEDDSFVLAVPHGVVVVDGMPPV